MGDQQRTFFVSYEGELTDEDLEALRRPNWKLFEIGSPAASRDERMPPVKWRQVVRLRAADGEQAMELVVEALGRRPDGLAADRNPPEGP